MFTRVFVGMRAYIHTHVFWGFPGGSVVTEVAGNLHTMQKTWVQSLGQEDPWRRKWQPTPVFLPGETRRERSLAGYSPRGRKEAGMTERLNNIRRYAYVCMCASLFFFFSYCVGILSLNKTKMPVLGSLSMQIESRRRLGAAVLGSPCGGRTRAESPRWGSRRGRCASWSVDASGDHDPREGATVWLICFLN